MLDDTFRLFPQLPIELRVEIWRLCLLHRVSEMDYPVDFMIYGSADPDDGEYACSLRSTSIDNTRPPLLTRVCRESRRIAFESGNFLPVLSSRAIDSLCKPPKVAWYATNRSNPNRWQAPSRDSAHLN